jgi:dihydrofolate reductase
LEKRQFTRKKGTTVSPRIIATNYISLDGVIEDPVGMENSGLGDWTGPYSRGPEGDRFKLEELADAQALIFGRLTYDGFAAVWPSVDDAQGFGERMNALPKFLASRTLKRPDWNNTSLIQGGLVDGVKAIKANVGGNILIYGSASIVHQLLPAGLIDEINLMIYPVALGRGKRLWPEGVRMPFALAENRHFNDGIVLLRYVKAS